MAYSPVLDTTKGSCQIVVMKAGEKFDLSQRDKRSRLAKILILNWISCISVYDHNSKYPSSIVDALEARKETTGGAEQALPCLHDLMKKKSADAVDVQRNKDKEFYGNRNNSQPGVPPASDSNTSGSDRFYISSSSVSQMENSSQIPFPHTDPRDLP